MTPEKEGELFAKLDLLIEMVRGLDGRLRAVEVAVGRLEGWAEEQSRLLQTLVPQTIAAVPGRKAAAT